MVGSDRARRASPPAAAARAPEPLPDVRDQYCRSSARIPARARGRPVMRAPEFMMHAATLVVVMLLAPLIPGIASRTRSILTARRGAPVWQLYSDLWKLLRRGSVYSRTTTVIFRLVPIALLACVVVSASMLPLDGRSAMLRFPGDVVAFAYVLALGRFVLVLGALDTGSSFEGMGASREVTFAALVEFGFFIALASLSVATHELSLSGMLGSRALAVTWASSAPALIMICLLYTSDAADDLLCVDL